MQLDFPGRHRLGLPIFLAVAFLAGGLRASPTVNDGLGGWTVPAGLLNAVSMPIPDVTITPGMTNVLLFKLQFVNQRGCDANLPSLAQIHYNFDFGPGFAVDSDFARVRLYYDWDGLWGNGNESEFVSGAVVNPYTAATCPRNFSPAYVQNHKAAFGTIFSPANELSLYNPWGTNAYVYLVADFSTNVIDQGAVKIRLPELAVMWQVATGAFYEQNMGGDILTGGNFKIQVTGTRLTLSGEPSSPGILAGQPFNLTATIRDDHGNIDQHWTGNLWLLSSDGRAVLPHTAGSPYAVTAADRGVIVFSNLQLFTGPNAIIRVSDGPLSGLEDGLSANILVIGDVNHFTLSSAGSNLPAGVNLVAGQPLDQSGVGSLRVVAFNYLNQVASNYAGSIYFTSSLPGAFDQFPSPYAFRGAADGGAKDFNARQVVLTRAGKQNLIVTDGQHKGEWLDLTVTPADFSALQVDLSATNLLAGVRLPISLTPLDRYSNAVTSLATTIRVSIKNVANTEPVNATFPSTFPMGPGTLALSNANAITIHAGGDFLIQFTDPARPDLLASLPVKINVGLGQTGQLVPINNYSVAGKAVALAYDLFPAKPVEAVVDIFTLGGRKVRSFPRRTLFQGLNLLPSWDTLDDAGRPVASGSYQVVVKGDGLSTSRAIVVVMR